MTSATDEGMDPVMHVFQTVILAITIIAVGCIRKWCVVRLRSNELICHRMKSALLSRNDLKDQEPNLRIAIRN